MKLICEINEDIQYKLEEAEGQPKKYFLEGIFMQADQKIGMEGFIQKVF